MAYWTVSHGLLRLLFYSAQDHEPMNSTAHSRLDPLTSIIHAENAPRDLPTGQTIWRYFLNLGLSSNKTPVCVDLTQNKSAQ